ncbi:uncharacterized protein CLUP02_07549 [Colletotrichum lupini]|uniref:Uncharacterized protein n=1 Tax=Colletotrichum lupini TaxID=145971 RepID=A0A9Q8SRE4_9PEZI|nr:uncharacterized protein CLUP02_07549 [Colletotrichum lupini]UQC82063.1 hypothetical protein CLUP02_07549 [Colletotrichum lupini]
MPAPANQPTNHPTTQPVSQAAAHPSYLLGPGWHPSRFRPLFVMKEGLESSIQAVRGDWSGTWTIQRRINSSRPPYESYPSFSRFPSPYSLESTSD